MGMGDELYMAFNRILPLLGAIEIGILAVAIWMFCGGSDSMCMPLGVIWGCSDLEAAAFKLMAAKLDVEVPGMLVVGEWIIFELVDGIDILILLAIIMAEFRFFTCGPPAPTIVTAAELVLDVDAIGLSKSNVFWW
jgi:hypothetical protein